MYFVMKIAFVSVLAHRDGDWSNHGVTSRFNDMYLYSDCTIEEARTEASLRGRDLDKCLYFVKEMCCGEWNYFAIPLVGPKGKVGPMFGGNFVYTSNGNGEFPRMEGINRNVPLRVHDRYETPEEYEALTR